MSPPCSPLDPEPPRASPSPGASPRCQTPRASSAPALFAAAPGQQKLAGTGLHSSTFQLNLSRF